MPDPIDRAAHDRANLQRSLSRYLTDVTSAHTQACLMAQLLKERHGLVYTVPEIPKRELLELAVNVCVDRHKPAGDPQPSPSADPER